MAQIFHRSFNVISKVSILGAVFILAGLGWAASVLVRRWFAARGIVDSGNRRFACRCARWADASTP